ncbi:uncharacterized protein LOC101742940 [Bombyx mori]|uniref:Uncharacterized protein n=1 Tax=Bombyx mori TaxID=7091 RepID=A0A8R2AN30_BOMMO|nr:uncharacterized protein LOC101742940 [Bombyx mori]
MEGMTKEESYAERRQLFKDIWITASNMDLKDNEVTTKPRVIKTLRLDDIDRSIAGKKKKERIKNLRAVCNKILEFCDRQDADDILYHQVVEDDHSPCSKEIDRKSRKNKLLRRKRKIKTRRQLSPPADTLNCEKKLIHSNKKSRHTSPIKNPAVEKNNIHLSRKV